MSDLGLTEITVTIRSAGSTELGVEPTETQTILAPRLTGRSVEINMIGGLPGNDGLDGGAAQTYEHTQDVPESEWIVNHNLGRRPAAVEVLSPGGLSILTEIVHISTSQLRVRFNSPQAGMALVI